MLVIPATPTTLIPMLRAIAYGWRQEALAHNAQEISKRGRELHERISVMATHWRRVGKNLGDAVGAKNGAVASLETRVLPSARRFKELEAVADGREIARIEQVELLPRALQAPEIESQPAYHTRHTNFSGRRCRTMTPVAAGSSLFEWSVAPRHNFC